MAKIFDTTRYSEVLIGFKEFESAFYMDEMLDRNLYISALSVSIFLKCNNISHIKIEGTPTFDKVRKVFMNYGVSRNYASKMATLYKDEWEIFNNLFSFDGKRKCFAVKSLRGYWEALVFYVSDTPLKEEESKGVSFNKDKGLYFRLTTKDIKNVHNIAKVLSLAKAAIDLYKVSKYTNTNSLAEAIDPVANAFKSNGSSDIKGNLGSKLSLTTLGLNNAKSRRTAATWKKGITERCDVNFQENISEFYFEDEENAWEFYSEINSNKNYGCHSFKVKKTDDRFTVYVQGTDSFVIQNGKRIRRIVPTTKPFKELKKNPDSPTFSKDYEKLKKSGHLYAKYENSWDTIFHQFPEKLKEKVVSEKKEAFNEENILRNIDKSAGLAIDCLNSAASGKIPTKFIVWTDKGNSTYECWTETYGGKQPKEDSVILAKQDDETLYVGSAKRVRIDGKFFFVNKDGEVIDYSDKDCKKQFKDSLKWIADMLKQSVFIRNHKDGVTASRIPWKVKDEYAMTPGQLKAKNKAERAAKLEEVKKMIEKRLDSYMNKSGMTVDDIYNVIEGIIVNIANKDNKTYLEAWKKLKKQCSKSYYAWNKLRKQGPVSEFGEFTVKNYIKALLREKDLHIVEDKNMAGAIISYLQGMFLSSPYFMYLKNIQTKSEYELMVKQIRLEKEERRRQREKRREERRANSKASGGAPVLLQGYIDKKEG